MCADRVYNTVLSYTRNAADAEEVTQTVFVTIYRKAGQFDGRSAPRTWIYRIAVNAALNHLRKRRRDRLVTGETLPVEPIDFEHPGILLEKREAAAALFRLIGRLPEAQQTAFILSYVEELPRKEVAAIMETSLKAVESLLHRAKQRLRTWITEDPHFRRN